MDSFPMACGEIDNVFKSHFKQIYIKMTSIRFFFIKYINSASYRRAARYFVSKPENE